MKTTQTPTKDVAVRSPTRPPAQIRDTASGKAAIWAGRTWWRHKLRLMPLSVSAVGIASAGMLHAATPEVAGWIEAGGVVTAVGAAGGYAELRRRNDDALNGKQVAYITACGMYLTGFELHATIAKPYTPTALATYGAATGVATVCWWLRGLAAAAPEEREQSVAQEAEAPEEEAPSPGKIWAKRIGCAAGPMQNSSLTKLEPLLDANGQGNGTTGIITLNADGGPIRHTVADITPQLGKISTGLDIHPSRLAVEPISENKARLMMFNRNPLTDPVPWRGPGDPGTYRHPAGMTPTGKWTHHPLILPGWGAVHELIVGSTGSGKSRTARLRLAMARHTYNKRNEACTATWLLDPHQGASYSGWRDRVDVLARSDEEIMVALAAAVTEKNRRLRILASLNREVLRPTPEMPHIRIIIDEFPAFIARFPHAAALIAQLVAEGRKVLIGLTVLTQYPTADKLGGDMSIRDGLLTTATVHRTGNQFTGMIVANGKQIGDPGALPLLWADGSSAAGVAYHLGTDSDHSVMMRAAVGGLDDTQWDWEDDEDQAPPTPYDEAWYCDGVTVTTETGQLLMVAMADGSAFVTAEEAKDEASNPEKPWSETLAQTTAATTGTMWDKIELFLSELGEEASTTQICKGIGEDVDKRLAAVSQTCSRAVEQNKLVKSDRGVWVLPQHARLVGAGR
ncbi:cell divisionFtsK/SpoIIIE [Catenulispora acidiphila DSM 44928]|uniref:Cell divisionFtsK/SpoIIIE n=1 Tax=Catenulispora acidiphila (strain DSM 44928 / JCM 14897 / NBRC 102108 / NRRL B-24433 / ID139908) TaxID=479433 RepID=C7Q1A5_CATAD|nr:cell division protein FtsK [Catenulispora acidiphila]ACU71780.1 cell divisionFtsK/SpoIIIE [Catenulispora acidiphila DSM 44928]